MVAKRKSGNGGNIDEQFMLIIDDLVLMSDKDSDLAEGLRWIDMQSRKNGMTFYEMAFMVLKKHVVEKRAKEWLNDKFNS
jgi:hypothetical protein